MNRLFTLMFGVVLLSVSLMSCDNGSPKAVAETYLEGFYKQDYDKARSVCTEDSKKYVSTVEQIAATMPEDTKDVADDIKVDIIDVKEDQDKAVVTYKVSTLPEEMKLELVLQGNQWLVNSSKQEVYESMGNFESDEATDVPQEATMSPEEK